MFGSERPQLRTLDKDRAKARARAREKARARARARARAFKTADKERGSG